MVTSPQHEAVCLDISGNLLYGYFAGRQLERKASSRRLVSGVATILASISILGVAGFFWGTSRSNLSGLRATAPPAALKDSGSEVSLITIPEGIRNLPAQFTKNNDEFVKRVGFALASRAPGMSLVSLSYSLDPMVGVKIAGQAEAPELANVRSYLNQFQVAVPEMEGMITTVARPSGATDPGKLIIDFEIRRAAQPLGGSQ